jgi:penicillin-binding protein 1A
VLAQRGEMAGANVALKDLPPYLPKAFIAIEDRRFYSHYGVDPVGIARAAVTNLLHRGVSQGGSTLTQQLAKNLFLTQERTLQRKLQEAELAIWLERKHSKSEILELYLNRVYFGPAPMASSAAQRYISANRPRTSLPKPHARRPVKSPSWLAPNQSRGRRQRAKTVLTAMVIPPSPRPRRSLVGHPSYNVRRNRHYVADWIGEVLTSGRSDRPEHHGRNHHHPAEAWRVAIIDELAAKASSSMLGRWWR